MWCVSLRLCIPLLNDRTKLTWLSTPYTKPSMMCPPRRIPAPRQFSPELNLNEQHERGSKPVGVCGVHLVYYKRSSRVGRVTGGDRHWRRGWENAWFMNYLRCDQPKRERVALGGRCHVYEKPSLEEGKIKRRRSSSRRKNKSKWKRVHATNVSRGCSNVLMP